MKRRHLVGAGIGLLIAIIAVVGLSSVILGQEPGDVGSRECRVVQLEGQDAVTAGGPYKNHGQMVRTAANVVSPYEEAMDITEECASCIMNQFARSIPIDEQEACGPDAPFLPECEGATCETFISCNVGGNCGDLGVCGSVYEGSGVCVDGSTPCAGLTECPNGTGDCAVGELCFVESCCVVNVCVPPEAFCWPAP